VVGSLSYHPEPPFEVPAGACGGGRQTGTDPFQVLRVHEVGVGGGGEQGKGGTGEERELRQGAWVWRHS
jgi:hypothetical protein